LYVPSVGISALIHEIAKFGIWYFAFQKDSFEGPQAVRGFRASFISLQE